MTSSESPNPADFRASAKRKRETAAQRASKAARISNTPNAYARRSPPRTTQAPPARNPSRSRSRSASPPRKQKRPGARATVDRNTTIYLQQQREEAARAEVIKRQTSAADLVAQHYNAVPERGREWRSTESQIRGLRSVNNWIKSTLIQKFSRPEGFHGRNLLVLDMACGKGGDLGKWEKAPIVPSFYVGCDIADVSISQARERYDESSRQRQRKGWRGAPPMRAEFYVLDTFGRSLGEIPVIREVGFDPSAGPGPGVIQGRLGGGGFDVVSMMFALHYSFENEGLARGMLKNVAGALKKGGRFIGVMPNSAVISATLKKLMAQENGTTPSVEAKPNGSAQVDRDDLEEGEEIEDDWDPEKPSDPQPLEKPADAAEVEEEEDDWDPEKPSEPVKIDEPAANGTPAVEVGENATPATAISPSDINKSLQWGNKLYSVRFAKVQPAAIPSGKARLLPADGVFRPPFGWKYHYSLQEAVDAPEFVVPFEALRALAEEYGLELMYRKGFRDVFEEEKDDPELGRLAERMGVMSRDRTQGGGTGCLVTEEEWEAASFYTCFVFYKT